MTFGERLKRLRKAVGESQTDLAIILGKPAASTVSGYETGYREPNFETIRTICEHYKVSADFLLGINGSEQASKGVINISAICENIKRIRIEQGLTQQQLADRCTQLMDNGKKMNGSAIRKYESGVVTPKFEVSQRIAAALGVSLSDLTNLVELSTLLDGRPVDLEYLRQAVKEKMERDAGEKDAD